MRKTLSEIDKGRIEMLDRIEKKRDSVADQLSKTRDKIEEARALRVCQLSQAMVQMGSDFATTGNVVYETLDPYVQQLGGVLTAEVKFDTVLLSKSLKKPITVGITFGTLVLPACGPGNTTPVPPTSPVEQPVEQPDAPTWMSNVPDSLTIQTNGTIQLTGFPIPYSYTFLDRNGNVIGQTRNNNTSTSQSVPVLNGAGFLQVAHDGSTHQISLVNPDLVDEDPVFEEAPEFSIEALNNLMQRWEDKRKLAIALVPDILNGPEYDLYTNEQKDYLNAILDPNTRQLLQRPVITRNGSRYSVTLIHGNLGTMTFAVSASTIEAYFNELWLLAKSSQMSVETQQSDPLYTALSMFYKRYGIDISELLPTSSPANSN